MKADRDQLNVGKALIGWQFNSKGRSHIGLFDTQFLSICESQKVPASTSQEQHGMLLPAGGRREGISGLRVQNQGLLTAFE